jgi:hypothetical protein
MPSSHWRATAGALFEPEKMGPNFSECAAGPRQCHRSRHELARGGGSATDVDTGTRSRVEEAIPPSVRQALMVRGHRVRAVTAVAGGMNGIQFDADTGVMAAAACWRADGSPAALGGGLARPGVRFRTTVRRDRG